MVGAFSYLYTVQTTPQIPHMALSASPRVPEDAQRAIRDALINAGNSRGGRQLLDHLRFQGFEPASPEIYEGYARLLQGVYGY
ncbi:MAG: phosphate/phosphite/phosphonate ABC transporter substrate-binding protein [Gammaproteobacteria bacterium]|nr:phosphate/phosphite/phosphonate ABC transporter substrate-binding protein [Gammaproteobacteria bacterium]NIR28315.1 phosphate/phosphite/phosphonate ABC transporter substrate-binding protein [Gammaproteobacteria bacterium]NIR96729.1 phosphate/phosphite/phosphonate ABC transporter substrate-binding protein [Gammaproteobacteria bacterium]NIT62431.1 phosphate/phosphite/phosphonate ABC transporter substrate-binding protein [Gammaproteobacteria bacterium]NIV19364.1 PhnD/SsuA/transferrin family sub